MKITLPRSAQKELDKIPNKIADKILIEIFQLRENPFPSGYQKLEGGSGYRIRLGDYRVVYTIDKYRQELVIVKVRHRKEAYKK